MVMVNSGLKGLKHHITFLKTDLIFLQPTQQTRRIDPMLGSLLGQRRRRWAKNDNAKFRLERVNTLSANQQAQYVGPMSIQCLVSVVDDGPTSYQH